MSRKIILASKSGVRKKILDQNNIICEVMPANVDEDAIKESMLEEKATPRPAIAQPNKIAIKR